MSNPSFLSHAEEGAVMLRGDLDDFDRDDLLEVLTKFSDQYHRDLLVDLADVTFLPSTVFSVLVRARTTAVRNGSSVTLAVREQTVPHRVLSVVGLPFRVLPPPDRITTTSTAADDGARSDGS